jgi:hypothetical protein
MHSNMGKTFNLVHLVQVRNHGRCVPVPVPCPALSARQIWATVDEDQAVILKKMVTSLNGGAAAANAVSTQTASLGHNDAETQAEASTETAASQTTAATHAVTTSMVCWGHSKSVTAFNCTTWMRSI